MARNLLIIAKVVPGIDPGVDAVIGRLEGVRDLFALTAESQSGRALLYWASWYDRWLMGDNLSPEDWRWRLSAQPITGGIWKLSLTDGDWPSVQQDAVGEVQYAEQHWVAWHLSQAFQSFSDSNDKAHLFFAREAMGASLSDDEVTEADARAFQLRLKRD